MSKVAEILALMAANAGQAQLRRGAIIGNTVEQATALPTQIYNDRQFQQQLDVRNAQVRQQMQLEGERGQREVAAAAHQTALDAKAQTAQGAADMKEKALKGIIGAGFEKDPATFDLPAAVSKAKELGAEDLIPGVMAVHEKMQGPKLMEADPTKNLVNPNSGAIVIPAEAKPPKPPTAEEDKAKYIALQARKPQGLPVLPAEQAWMDAYEKEKGLNIDKSAAAASDRQSATIAAQTAQQKRGQDFEVLKTARSDIQKNADTPYQSALSAADELRGMVKAAQSGNKIAASEQALTTAAATIRGFGLNRINMAEIGMPASAGSAADRVANFIGKWTEGQPVNADLQKDMLGVADVLEKAARKKYETTHGGINKLYGTSIPQTFPAEATPTTTTTPTAGLPSYADYLASKQKK